jgi:hypothetical protein
MRGGSQDLHYPYLTAFDGPGSFLEHLDAFAPDPEKFLRLFATHSMRKDSA